ncbi:hypothetical protein [Deinococcus alpinitundrae]|uniref:hypothetical protein n=1 Tax=Deinococcus alpinitundrae TaxID=468913 RepID=UPI00137AAD73|nr:hypothetical protein [Deinococcus alpinitundrae]
MTTPSLAQRREALRRMQGWLLRRPGDFEAELHWLSHAEQLGLDSRLHLTDWEAALKRDPAQHDHLGRDAAQLRALHRQLRALYLSRAAAIFETAAPAPWHDWLRLILDGSLEAPSTGRAAQLRALLDAYRRGKR